MRIEIEKTTDEHDCETCGFIWANGAIVTIDGEKAFELVPSAYCWDSDDYSDEDICQHILRHIGDGFVYSDEYGAYRTRLDSLGHEVVFT